MEVAPALKALARTPGLTMVRGQVVRLTGDARRWRVEASDGRVWFSATVVLATGAGEAVAGLPDSDRLNGARRLRPSAVN
jgi:glycine oxidase